MHFAGPAWKKWVGIVSEEIYTQSLANVNVKVVPIEASFPGILANAGQL